MNDFDFVQARDRDDALRLVAGPSSVLPLSGGTNLLVNLKRAPIAEELLVDLSQIQSLRSVSEVEDGFRLGSGVTFAQILQWQPGGAIEALMRPMAATFAGPLIRNLATVGGNLCDASPAADVSPPLLALDAKVSLESVAGSSRLLPLDEFFLGVRSTALRSDELLISVDIPKSDPSDAAFYYKLGKRKADAISIVSVAIVVRQVSGVVAHVRIALGAVAKVAMRSRQAETVLQGNSLSANSMVEAAKTAATEVSPIDDFRASAAYRRDMVEVLVLRGLQRIAESQKEQ